MHGNTVLFIFFCKKVESGIDGGLKEGIEYIFMVSAYTYTMYNLTFVLAPGKE